MNLRDLTASWQNFHKASGLGAPIADERQYQEVLAAVDQLMDELGANEASPIAGLVELMAERIHEYEARVHPWPATSTPAQVLHFLMEHHGMRQADLAQIGSQGVVSEILSGKRELNARQIANLAQMFHVSPAVFFQSAPPDLNPH